MRLRPMDVIGLSRLAEIFSAGRVEELLDALSGRR